MAAPIQLNVVIIQNNGGTVTTSTVVVPISAALQALDSQNASGGGQAVQQTGFSAVDLAVKNIFRAECFFVPSTNTWYPISVIQNITWQ